MKPLNHKKNCDATTITSRRKRQALLAEQGIPKFMIRFMRASRNNFASGETTFRPRHD